MANKILTKSDKFTSEYCCSILKIGEVKPIEGKDKIGYTLVNNETIVVRKDQVKEGDILFYASNETQLDKEFLSKNNLFESCELNSNREKVEPIVNDNKDLKAKCEELENVIKSLYISSKRIISYDSDIILAEGNQEDIDEINEDLEDAKKCIIKYISELSDVEFNPMTFVSKAQERCAKLKIEFDELKKEIENNNNFIRSHVGFFNKTGRVRSIRLGGVQSMGYLFSLEELAKYNPKVKEINIEELVGEDFDTVDGQLFIKAYVPFVPETRKRDKSEKRNKKIEQFDRMIKGEFSFHYDTQPFPKCVSTFKPTDNVLISNKLHGTSMICGKVKVKIPIKLPFIQRLWDKFIDFTGLFKSLRIIDYIIDYGNVTSSRTVIKNKYINKNVSDGFYERDIWSEYGDLIYPYLDNGMTVYGEICGYITNSEKMIQKGYDYGCEVGENFLMPYRITTTNLDGTKKEWNCSDVKIWTDKLINEHPELSKKIHPLTVFYEGTLQNLYPD